ncbi:MAG: hypothetical protein CMJ31_03205 [Phycisphaerae bacterium]|nr:hypothetical protein [Phycisphaerae bacterium]
MGGSQGARSVNDFIAAHLAHDPDAWRDHGWQAIHLAGEGAVERIGAAYEKASVRARVLPFTDDIGAAWSAATLHVGRAGAGAVAEAQVAGVPSLFFPYPFHKDRHQAHNAQPLVARGQARILDDQRTAEANLACHGSDFSESLRANAVAPPRDIRSIEDGARGAIDTLVKQGYLASCYLEPGAPQSERFIQTPS